MLTQINTSIMLNRLYEELKSEKSFGFDTETTGLNYGKDTLKIITFYYPDKSYFYRYDPKDNEILNKIFNNHCFKIAHDAPFDINFLFKSGITVTKPLCSKMLAAIYDDRDQKVGYGLKPLAEKYLGYKTIDFKQLLKNLGIKTKELDKLYEGDTPQELIDYATADAKYCYELYKLMYPVVLENFPKVYELENDLTPVVAKIQRNGMPIDTKFLDNARNLLGHKMMATYNELSKEFGQGINFNSPKQLREILFDQLKLKPVKNTPKGVPSTDFETLTKLAEQNDKLDKILEYRSLQKQLTTYVEPWLEMQENGRLYTYFHPWGTNTGRFNSSDPNIQNVPASHKAAKRGLVPLREAFVAPEGYNFIKADYSQLELRVLAFISADEGMCQAFIDGEDIHQKTQDLLKLSDRRIAKVVNFGIAYGMSAMTLMTRLLLEEGIKINLYQSSTYIKKFFKARPGVAALKLSTERFLKLYGYVQTPLGRRRHFPQLNDNRVKREAEKREAFNMRIQGYGGEIMKKALIDIDKEMCYADILATVHDEVLLLVKEEDTDKGAADVTRIMEGVYPCRVPWKADVKVVKRWC